MQQKVKKYIKLIITIAIPCLFIWFLVIAPYLEFKSNEKTFKEAAKRYYELNSDKLPTGKRVSTVTLKTLYNDAYIKEDFFTPYTNKPCSITESWVKVSQNDAGEYEYITYLQCGIFKSSVDHEGPTIKLKGATEITINRGEEYVDPGIESVSDNKDKKMSIDDVTIDTSKVNTDLNGTYEVTYTAIDSLKNKTTVTRKVNVVQKLSNTVKQETENGTYRGEKPNNYIYFSGMLFRIIGLDDTNVKIIAANDIANVNYDGIEEWLEYFYEHVADSSKKYVVKNKYCTGTLSSENVNSNTTCISQTKNRNIYIASNKELNETRDENGLSYIFARTMSWTANTNDENTAWAYKDAFINSGGSQFYGFQREYNFGVRPLLTIKGDTLITSGDGTEENPYFIGDIKKGLADEYLNTRYSGEYITYSGFLWRIIETADDETTKVIAVTPTSGDNTIGYETTDEIKIYDPTQKGNIGYTINQKTGNNVNEEYFVTKEIKVPIYKTVAKYGEEVETKKYKVKFSAPNMYELFSTTQEEINMGYWLINSSQEEYRKYMVSYIGIVMYEQLSDNIKNGIRPVGYLDKRVKIVSGSGTKNNPYKISK